MYQDFSAPSLNCVGVVSTSRIWPMGQEFDSPDLENKITFNLCVAQRTFGMQFPEGKFVRKHSPSTLQSTAK